MAILNLLNLNTYDVAMILSNIFTVFVAHEFFSIFVYEKKNEMLTKFVYILYGIAIIISSIFIDIPLINLMVTLGSVSFITFSYRIEYNKALLLISLYCVIMFIGELISVAITGRLFIGPLIRAEYENIFGLFFCKILTFIVVLLLQNIKFFRSSQSPPITYALLTIIMPVSSIVLGSMIMSISGVTKAMVLLSMSVLILINILTFTLYDKISVYYGRQIETVSLKQENLFYHNQLNFMNESVQEMSAFRHDIQNHFNMIEGYLKSNRLNEAIAYIEELKGADSMLESNLVNTGNFIVDSILNYKLSTIQDVETELEVFVPSSIEIDTVHFVSILTNLLDNAIEALRSMKEKDNRILRIRIVYSKGRLIMTFQNSYDGGIVYEDGEICSSKHDSDRHGYGLTNVKRAIEPYDGLLKINHNGEIFSIQALLYVG